MTIIYHLDGTYNLKYRRLNMKAFRACPSTNDLSEGIIASCKHQKRRTANADWQTIESTTIMNKNQTIEYLKETKNKTHEKFCNAMEILSQSKEKDLIKTKIMDKKTMQETKANIVKKKIKHQKKVEHRKQLKKNQANNTILLTMNEVENLFKSNDYKSKIKRIYFLKEQLKTYKVKYSNKNIDGFPIIHFSKNGKLLKEDELTNILNKCIETTTNHHNNNNNDSDNDNNNMQVLGEKRTRNYIVDAPNSKRRRILKLPNIDNVSDDDGNIQTL